ncbi:MFS transporter [Corynebacterium alimapuense]|uniref:MFS transporter n=2 Tax=Corynebacterium alimapuense TaxID=1576874 RepID=A0A3M8K4V6_9CORY|nr:MFS transporter [Corynebacterium alimapuense]
MSTPSPTESEHASVAPSSIRAGTIGAIIAILLVAMNLRATLTGVGVLLPAIEQDTGLTSAWGGALTTLPLVMFAVTSPFVVRMSNRLGTTRLMVVALAVLALGTVVRSVPSLASLFIGTIILSAAIAVGNVLLPSVVRQHVPASHVHIVSSIYVTVMALIAGVSSGISVPLANALPGGWRAALAWGIVLTIPALVVWLLRLRRDSFVAPARSDAKPSPVRMPWKSALAWQVSLYMGLQSLVFYTIIAWLPSILIGTGMTASQSGWMLFFFQGMGILSSLSLPIITRGRQDQRYVAAIVSVFVAAGFLVLLIPGQGILACMLLGLGSGGALALAMSFQSQRAGGYVEAAALAGMAQTIGYLVAATGPLLLGVLHTATGAWTSALFILSALSILMAVAGYQAGRDRRIPHSAFD